MSGGDDTAADAPTPAIFRVGSLAALRSGPALRAKAGRQTVAVFALGDDVVVTNGRCPHAFGPLHEGEVAGSVLTCPWHGWSFDLRTGSCEEDPSLLLQIYPSHIEGDDIMAVVG